MFIGRIASRRHLPHYQSDFKTYFVTFSTRKRFVLPNAARDIVLRHVTQCAMYWLHVAVVMPDHVHLLVTPDQPLGFVMGRVKGASSREVNLLLGRYGSLWQQENFDHELRQAESLLQKAEYIRQNPVRKGLVERAEDYPWLWWNPQT